MYNPTLLEPIFSRWGIPLRGARFLVAFSGGLDSTVLAQSMVCLADRHGFTLTLGHINHRLRTEADRDEAFCQEFANSRGLPFHTASLDPGGREKESIEAWARRERYAALENMRLQVGAKWILTAHHADDQVETVLMRLMQQAPLMSLAGVRPQWRKVLRPLLSFTREQLCEWAVCERLEWVEDQTNIDQRFLRNRLRHALVADDTNARDTLLGLARLAQEYEARCVAVAKQLTRLATEGTIPGTAVMPIEALSEVEEDIFKLAVQEVVQRFLGITLRLSSPHWQNFRHFVRVSTVGKVFELPHSVLALRDRGQVVFYRIEQAVVPEKCALKPGRTRWGYNEFLVTPMDSPAGATDLWLRSWRSGDRAVVTSGRRPKLVSDIYIDAHLNCLEKVHWPLVVTEQDEVVWVPGLGVPRDRFDKTPWSIVWQTQFRKR
ncbi:MAG: tRNA lysidine(34) synthetase TilS [Candidatus Neomarinimicrobiota bacterium]